VALRHDSGSWSPTDGASRPHAPEAVGLLWTSDQPEAENSDNTQHSQHTALTTDIHTHGGNRTCNATKRAAADRRLRRRGYWNWHKYSRVRNI